MSNGIFANLLNHEQRQNADWSVIVEAMNANRESANSVTVTPESSLHLGAVFAAASLLADTIGSLPLILYERQERSRKRASDHYLYSLLHDAPNEMMTAVEYRSAMEGYLALRGNAISQIEYDAGGRITELWPLRWENVVDLRVDKENGRIFYHYMNPDGKIQWLDNSIVWHLRGWGSDGIVGYSPITLARRTVELGLSAEEFGVRFFKNDARPGIVVEHPGKLSQTAHDNIEKSFEDRHQGVSKSHRLQILEEGMKIHEIGIPPEDAQFLQTRQFTIAEIARFFRVPPHMIGDLEHATFTNIEHQGIEFVTYSLQSWMTRWEQSIKQNLLLPADRARYYAEHLVDSLLRGDTLARYQAYNTGINSGWLTRADAREKENLEPIDGLEKPLVPLNMMTIDQAEEGNGQLAAGSGGQEGDQQRDLPVGEERRKKSAVMRHRLAAAWQRMYRDIAGRVIRREANDVKAEAGKALEKRGLSEFLLWLEQFYLEHREFTQKQFLPLNLAYSQVVSGVAADEIKLREGYSERIESFSNAYTASYAARHGQISLYRLKKAIKTASDANEDLNVALEEEFQHWDEERVNEISLEESVRLNNATAVEVYLIGGWTTLRWVAAGSKSCPYCRALDGTVVDIHKNFLEPGNFQPEGVDTPLAIEASRKHPPAHAGCVCMTMAG